MSAVQSLKESGLKATLPRRKILELFESSKVRHLSAEDVYKALITETRTKFEEIQGGYRAGRYDSAGRNLMVDGLLKRFLEQVDEV